MRRRAIVNHPICLDKNVLHPRPPWELSGTRGPYDTVLDCGNDVVVDRATQLRVAKKFASVGPWKTLQPALHRILKSRGRLRIRHCRNRLKWEQSCDAKLTQPLDGLLRIGRESVTVYPQALWRNQYPQGAAHLQHVM